MGFSCIAKMSINVVFLNLEFKYMYILKKCNVFLHKTVNVYTIDFMCWLGVLLAVQNTSCPLSVLTTRLRSCDVVFTEPFNATLVYVDWLVMSVVDLYHVISAGGLQYDVVHVRLICCPAITVVEFRVNVTDVTGTVKLKNQAKNLIKVLWDTCQDESGFKYIVIKILLPFSNFQILPYLAKK